MKRKPKNSAKNLSTSLQVVNDPLENQLGYMTSNRPSKPNLPNAPKPSKLLAPTRLRRTMSFLTFRIPQLAHCINQYELVLSWTASQHQEPSHYSGFGEIRIWFIIFSWVWQWKGESRGIWRIKCIRLWMNQSCFSLGFLSQNSL